MHGASFGRASGRRAEPPIELRFVDLFMILLTGFIFITAVMSIRAAFAPHTPDPGDPLRVVTDSLPHALRGRSYRVTLAAAGGTGAYGWESRGPWPAWLALAPDGTVSGTPPAEQVVTLEVAVRAGSSLAIDARSLELKVVPAADAPSESFVLRPLGPTALPDARLKEQYSQTLEVAGGSPPYRWKAAGPLPLGLVLSTAGVLSGKPQKGTPHTAHAFDVVVTDGGGTSATQKLRLWLLPAAPNLWQRAAPWLANALFILILWFGGAGLKDTLPALLGWLRSRGQPDGRQGRRP